MARQKLLHDPKLKKVKLDQMPYAAANIILALSTIVFGMLKQSEMPEPPCKKSGGLRCCIHLELIKITFMLCVSWGGVLKTAPR